MADQKIRLPSSGGGLVRYYESEYKSKYQLKPVTIVAICIVVIVFGIILTVFGKSWFGV